MDFDPNFQESFPLLSGLFPENPPKPPEFPVSSSHMVLFQTSSQNNSPLFQTSQNFHHFQQHPQLNLNGSNPNPNPVFPKEGPSSSSIPYSPPTVPFEAAYANESFRDFINTYHHHPSPNNKMDAWHGYHTGRGFWDLSHKLPIPSEALTVQVGPSLPPFYHQAYGSSPKPKLQDELLLFFPGNNGWEEDARGDQRDDDKKKKVQMRKGILRNTNIIKGQWTPEEDRYS